jgi:hypothetical protein
MLWACGATLRRMGEVRWPFIGAEALAAHVIAERAMRKGFEDLYPGVYIPKRTTPTARQRAIAAWLWSKRRGVVAGHSAAAMHGVRWVEGHEPAELIHDNQKTRKKLIVRTDALLPGEVVRIGAVAVTSPARTAFDIGRYTVDRLTAMQRIDAVMNLTGVTVGDIEAIAAAHPGVRGLKRLRSVLRLADGGAESPHETAARLALIDAGLPAPTTQYRVYGDDGRFIGRVDMAYEDVKVAIEYDGEQHWTDPVIRGRDIDKGVAYVEARWHVVRTGSDLLYKRRATYVARVVAPLRERGFIP